MTSTIIEDMAALLVKIGRCPLPPDIADEVREILERIRKDGFYPEPMTNIDWLQWFESFRKGSALEWLDGFCPHHDASGACGADCPYRHDGDGCNAYTAGMDALAHWLFKERKEVSDADKQQD